MEKLFRDPENYYILEAVKSIIDILAPLSLTLNLWKAQNIYFLVGKQIYKQMEDKAGSGDEESKIWIEHFRTLGNLLKIRIN